MNNTLASSSSCQFHHLLPKSIPATLNKYFSAPASVHTHPLVRGPSLSRGETYWLRHSGKPRASSACTPARLQLYLHPLHYLPPSTNKVNHSCPRTAAFTSWLQQVWASVAGTPCTPPICRRLGVSSRGARPGVLGFGALVAAPALVSYISRSGLRASTTSSTALSRLLPAS